MMTYAEMATIAEITALLGLFALQLYSLMTPKGPRSWIGWTLAGVTGGLGTWAIYKFWPLGYSTLHASIAGVYGWTGTLYALGIGALIFVFGLNAYHGWRQNRPIKIFQ
jgi:drug/metabolite transporter (DMT)-like permease